MKSVISKIIQKAGLLAAMAALLSLAACTDTELPATTPVLSPTLKVSVEPIRIYGEQVPYDTRATVSLPTEKENSMFSLAVLVFDVKEGVLQRFSRATATTTDKYYKFINLTDTYGNGLLNVDLNTQDFPVETDEEYTVCLVANLPEDSVVNIVNDLMIKGDGMAHLRDFKEVTVPIHYISKEEAATGTLEEGHVSDLYMFGYYQGVVRKSDGTITNELNISLGRIISRLELAFTVDRSLLKPGYSFFGRMENVETTARLFPTGISPGIHYPDASIPLTRYSSIESGRTVIYFYVGPNSAQSLDQALRFRLWYLPADTPQSELNDLGRNRPETANAVIHLCNDSPGDAMSSFNLQRNSAYRFNLNLVNK